MKVEVESVTDYPVRDVFQDTRGLIYALPQAEPEVIIRHNGHQNERLGRAADKANGLELPPGYEHSLLFQPSADALLSISKPTRQISLILLADLSFKIYSFVELGLEGDLLSIGFAKNKSSWLTIAELEQPGKRMKLYEWNLEGVSRSFPFSTNRIVEDAKQVAVGDSILLDVYTGGAHLYDWDGNLLKTFILEDFEGAVQRKGLRAYSYLSELRHQPDGELYASIRHYSPSLYRYDADSVRFFPAEQPFGKGQSNYVSIPVADSLGNKLFAGGGFYGQRPFFMETAEGKRIDLGTELEDAVLGNRNHDDNRTFVSKDVTKTIFAASESRGLLRINLPKPRVRSFYRIFGWRNPIPFGTDSLVISSWEHGMYRMSSNPDKLYRHVWYKDRKGVIRGSKGSFFDRDGRLWCNDRTKLFGVDFGTNSAVEIPIPAEIDEAWTLYQDDAALLSLVDGSMVKVGLIQGEVAEIPKTDFPAYDKVLLLKAREDQLWMATDRGFYRGKVGEEKSWKLLPTTTDTPLLVYDVFVQGEQWWLATNQGWGQYDPVTHTTGEWFTEEDGLISNSVRSSTFAKGHFWIGTRSGLSRLNPETGTFKSFTHEQGFTSRAFTRGAVYVPGGDFIGMGTDNGYNYFKPDDLLDDPTTAISWSSLRYFSMDSTQEVRQIGNAHLVESISLPAEAKSLEVMFFLSDLSQPREHRFAYRLRNTKDTTWTELGNINQVIFTSLAAGDHLLEVRGRTRYSAWSEPIALQLRVARFFYQTWWFRIALFLLVSFLISAWVIRLRRERSLLKQKVEERTETIRKDKEVIEKQTEDLKALDAAKTRFFANISHEFRTPLTVIRGFTKELIRSGGKIAPDKLEQNLGLIEVNSDRLLLLVNQLLELGKLEAGKLGVTYQRTDLRPELDLILASFQAVAFEKDIRLQNAIAFTQLMGDIDVDKLLKILYNLLSNAIKFTQPGGVIGLSAGLDGEDCLRISVTDNGIGIPADRIETIFQRFTQLDDDTTRKEEGSGIGLNYARELARLMNGELSVVSTKGEGSTFTLSLPRWREGKVSTTEPTQREVIDYLPRGLAPSADRQVEELTSGELPRILIVEDNPDIIAYLKLCLYTRFQLTAKSNGREGLQFALEHIPDLVITDVMMPVMDGLEMCRNLKRDVRTSHVPVIMLTALSSVKNRVKGLREGADAYLSKPFEREELDVQIVNLLEGRKRLRACFIPGSEGISETAPLSETDEDYHRTENAFLARLREIIVSQIDNSDFRTEDLAREVTLSQSQLWRKVKAVTGLSTKDFIADIKMGRAMELLEGGNLTVSEVAYAVGFSDPSYFTKRFSRHFSVTPSSVLAREVRG